MFPKREYIKAGYNYPMNTELYLWRLKKRMKKIFAQAIKVRKVLLWYRWLKWLKISYTKIYCMYVTAMTLAKRRTQVAFLVVVTIKIIY